MLLIALLPGWLVGQQVVVMPHRGIDSLTVNRQNCYTILDPGGYSNYTNNEDSWLYIRSTSGNFKLRMNYQTSANGDCNDYFDMYYSADSNNSYYRYCGVGENTWSVGEEGTLIHFHSNAYASFQGFEIRVLYPNTIYNWGSQTVDDSTVTLTWEDSQADATEWTITYFCDEDSLHTVSSNTRSVTITGLRNNTYYGYYIQSNATACMEVLRKYFIAGHPDNMLYTEPSGSNFNLTSGTCYTINSTSGPGRNNLSTGWANTNISTTDNTGFYVDGWSSNYTLQARWNTGYGFGSSIYYWDQNSHRNHKIYFPNGNASFQHTGRTKFLFNTLWENNHVIVPTVTDVTTTTATLQWTDTSASTQWTVRYSSNDGNWISRTVSTPSITLTGLDTAKQYLYTIEGNVTQPCVIPYRHSFITAGMSDTLIMPYRKAETTVLMPGNCYTVVDAGGSGSYFSSDYSIYTLRTANGEGFRLKGWYNITSPDLLCIYYDGSWHNYTNSNSDLEIYCADGTCTLGITSNPDENGLGFAFNIIQMDTAITNLQATAVGSTTATLTWDDPAPTSNGWQVHYCYEEDNYATVFSATPSVTLTGLMPGTQYVYYVTRQGVSTTCHFPNRKAFITQGGDSNTVIMPYRGVDTLRVTPGQCYNILDAGGEGHSYFNYDTSHLIIVSTDGSDFFLTGEFDYESLLDIQQNGYDNSDVLCTSNIPSNSDYYDNCFDGNWTWYNGNRFRVQSQNGFLRLRWLTNERNFRHGFHLHIDQDTLPIEEVQAIHIKSTSAEISWSDNSSFAGPWHISYTSGNTWTTIQSATNHTTLTGLQPSTNYRFRISRTAAEQTCNLQTYNFATLNNNDIVMNSHSRDTVWITPGECYTVYDPGGIGNYYSSDTSTIVIRSTTGLGFRLFGTIDVGDLISFNSNGSNGYSYWGVYDNYYPDGIAYLTLTTNEAINYSGFALNIIFYPTLHSLDTLWQTDTSMAITWQDTSAANQWTVTYGLHMDSLRTITTSTPQATLTGLHRNSQCYIDIESNFSSTPCVIPSVYGIRMPHDPNIWITQYHNTILGSIGRHSNVESNFDIIPSSECVHIYDNGGFNPPFPNCTMDHDFNSSDGRGLSVNGNYNLGSSYLHINTGHTATDYSGIGNTFVSSPSGYLCIVAVTDPDIHGNGEGFDFEVLMNYAIHQITPSAVTCSTATLTWVDTSDATRWWIAYGPDERMLDTVTTTSRSYHFTGLIPDRQYICYLWSNESVVNCNAPVKSSFITTCDSSIIIMPYNVDTSITLDINRCYTLLDIGGPHNYHYNGNQSLHIHSNTGDPIVLRGNIHIHGNDNITIYDEGSWTWYLSNWQGDNDNFEIHSSTGNICIIFNSNGDTLNASGFDFQVFFNTIGNIRTDLMTDTTCRIRWDDNSSANHWTVWYGPDADHMDSISTSNRTVHLDNLIDGTQYQLFITNNAVECIDTTWFQFCAGGDKCIDFANLYSCHTRCRYGEVNYPDMYDGVVDYGPDNIYSRHTVMIDTSYRDPRTGNLLRTIPQYYDYSVRLGNWNYGGEAESITYEYIVDTATADILLLRYAAVLENPNHQPQDQPRFRFSIVNEYDTPIIPECYSANFVSSDSLNWNTYQYDTSTVLWKDWTAVGIDLEPFQGQRIFVKLTTYDCAQTGHFGYAYFTLSCDQKYIHAGSCGNVQTNTFTAPEGFRYQWYNTDSSNVILDTTRSYSSSQAGTYVCRASFVGNSESNCYFEKTVIVGNIFPYPNFTYSFVDTIDCRVKVRFQNLSCAASDPELTQLTSMECESYIWDFGDGDSSYLRHPTHIFEPGYHYVRLRAALAHGSCYNDTVVRILIPSPCIHYDTITTAICQGDTFHLSGSAFTQTGAYIVRQTFAPDSIVETLLFLTVHPSYLFTITDTLCSNQSYNRYGITVAAGSDPYTTQYYESTFHTPHGCDSIYHLTLVTMPNFETHADAEACDDHGYQLYNRVVYQSGAYTDSLHTHAGCDSVVHLNLTVHPAFHDYTIDTVCEGADYRFHDTLLTSSGSYSVTYLNVYGCDSAFHIDLTLHPRYDFYDSVTLCPRQPYYLRGQAYYAPANITDTFYTIQGCDSLYHTKLKLNNPDFYALWEISDDSLHWTSTADTLWEGCSPYTLYFRNRSNLATASIWHFGDSTTRAQGAGPYDSTLFLTHSYKTGTYTFFLAVNDDNGCTDTLFNPTGIHVIPSPTASFFWDTTQTSELHPYTTFHNNSIPLDSTCSSFWQFEKQPYSSGDDTPPDDVDTTSVTNPSYHWDTTDVELPATYRVWLTLTQMNIGLHGDTLYCADTIVDTVRIVPSTLQFPNTVTPNNDGYNDIFYISNLIEYNRYPYNKLSIYDRWGHLVYQVDNISREDQFWNPDLTNAPDGTYYYRFVGQGSDGSVQHNGVIEVMRKPN